MSENMHYPHRLQCKPNQNTPTRREKFTPDVDVMDNWRHNDVPAFQTLILKGVLTQHLKTYKDPIQDTHSPDEVSPVSYSCFIVLHPQDCIISCTASQASSYPLRRRHRCLKVSIISVEVSLCSSDCSWSLFFF